MASLSPIYTMLTIAKSTTKLGYTTKKRYVQLTKTLNINKYAKKNQAFDFYLDFSPITILSKSSLLVT